MLEKGGNVAAMVASQATDAVKRTNSLNPIEAALQM